MYDVFSPSSAKADVWAIPVAADKKPFAFLQTVANESRAQFSPDGRWVLYTSDESGRDEVYVTSFPDRGGKMLISKDGGTYPRWRRDGKEIFYVAPDGKCKKPSDKYKGRSGWRKIPGNTCKGGKDMTEEVERSCQEGMLGLARFFSFLSRAARRDLVADFFRFN